MIPVRRSLPSVPRPWYSPDDANGRIDSSLAIGQSLWQSIRALVSPLRHYLDDHSPVPGEGRVPAVREDQQDVEGLLRLNLRGVEGGRG
jgi:hypothetical protein